MDEISPQLAAWDEVDGGGGVSREPGKGQLIAMECFVFVISFGGAQGNLLLSCLTVSIPGTLFFSPSWPGSVGVPAPARCKWGCKAGCSRVPGLYETHTFASMTLQPNVSSTTFYY